MRDRIKVISLVQRMRKSGTESGTYGVKQQFNAIYNI